MRDGKTASKSLRVVELALVLEAIMNSACTLVKLSQSLSSDINWSCRAHGGQLTQFC